LFFEGRSLISIIKQKGIGTSCWNGLNSFDPKAVVLWAACPRKKDSVPFAVAALFRKIEGARAPVASAQKYRVAT
ncbi:hypothetical protein, partial [Escherichia coli]|uniref:hypothetical protein n=1 Tax=Escherichia coli TaxID=562 RepID=UPI001BFC57B0